MWLIFSNKVFFKKLQLRTATSAIVCNPSRKIRATSNLKILSYKGDRVWEEKIFIFSGEEGIALLGGVAFLMVTIRLSFEF